MMVLRDNKSVPIQVDETTLEITMPTGDVVEIGDKESVDFKPHVKMNRWGKECNITLSLQTTEKPTPIVDGELIKWDGQDQSIVFNPKGKEESFEFDIILKKKPITNVFPMAFGSQNLVFFYQPPLTEEHKNGWSDFFQDNITVTETEVKNSRGEIVVSRPENVVGSYAVYHATKKPLHSSKANAEKYKICKAFHWMRPLCWDSVGAKVWGILNADPIAEIRTITIPQDFLDKAVYPVTIDDTFGHDPGSHGGTQYQGDDDYIMGTPYTCSEAGTATHLSWYNWSGTYDDGPQKLGMYQLSDGVFIIGTAEVSGQPTNQYNTIALTAQTGITAQDYILCHWGEEYSLAYDSVASAMKYVSKAYPDDWPSPQLFGTYNFQFSYYCTYTTGGGGWANIAKVGGVTATDLAKVDGIAVADIAKINGVAV